MQILHQIVWIHCVAGVDTGRFECPFDEPSTIPPIEVVRSAVWRFCQRDVLANSISLVCGHLNRNRIGLFCSVFVDGTWDILAGDDFRLVLGRLFVGRIKSLGLG